MQPEQAHAGASGAPDDLLEHAPAGFLSFRDDGMVEVANATLLSMLGGSSDDVTGRHIENILTVGTRIFYQTHWFPLLRMHGRAEEIFLMLRSSGGEPIGVLANAVRRERGGVTVNDCVLMHVRERQKYEDELLRARNAAEQANAQLEKRQAALQEANEQLSEQAVELEIQQHQLQEQTAELEVAQEELHATNEELRDQAEQLERARAAAEVASAAKSSFLAVMSHELRTPLNAIAGYTDLIDLGVQGPVTASQRQSLERIKRSQRHLLRLINEVLNLARIESGLLDYDIERVQALTLVDVVAEMVQPQMIEKQLAFERHGGEAMFVLADRDKAEQILLNLLSNALKFTPAGGRIEVRVDTDGDGTVDIAVTDSGIGIPPDRLDSVFEPFMQVDVSRTSRKEGTGLGLAISRDLALGMSGDLIAQSIEGKGSTFTLILPRAL